MTALYTMTMRIARGEEGNVAKEYFLAFHDNFRQATLLWSAFGSVMLFLDFDISLLRSVPDAFGFAYRVILFMFLLFLISECIHVFAFQARFESTAKGTARNALLFMSGHLPQSALMLAVTASPLLLQSASFHFISVLFLLGLSGPACLAGLYFRSSFRPYEGTSSVSFQAL